MSRCKVSVVVLSSSKSSLSLSRERKEEEEDKEDKDKERKAVLFFVVVAGALFVLSALLFCLVCFVAKLSSLSLRGVGVSSRLREKIRTLRV